MPHQRSPAPLNYAFWSPLAAVRTSAFALTCAKFSHFRRASAIPSSDAGPKTEPKIEKKEGEEKRDMMRKRQDTAPSPRWFRESNQEIVPKGLRRNSLTSSES